MGEPLTEDESNLARSYYSINNTLNNYLSKFENQKNEFRASFQFPKSKRRAHIIINPTHTHKIANRLIKSHRIKIVIFCCCCSHYFHDKMKRVTLYIV